VEVRASLLDNLSPVLGDLVDQEQLEMTLSSDNQNDLAAPTLFSAYVLNEWLMAQSA
jgi:hypothetical protein